MGNGLCRILTDFKNMSYKEKRYKRIGMLGAGTGITPLFQLLQAADRNSDTCEFTLFFGNSTEKDILLRTELDKFEKNKNFKFKLVFIITRFDEKKSENNNIIIKEENTKEIGNENKDTYKWKGELGHFNYENISKYMPEPSDDTLVVYCGRKALCLEIYEKSLLKMGHSKDNIFKF